MYAIDKRKISQCTSLGGKHLCCKVQLSTHLFMWKKGSDGGRGEVVFLLAVRLVTASRRAEMPSWGRPTITMAFERAPEHSYHISACTRELSSSSTNKYTLWLSKWYKSIDIETHMHVVYSNNSNLNRHIYDMNGSVNYTVEYVTTSVHCVKNIQPSLSSKC